MCVDTPLLGDNLFLNYASSKNSLTFSNKKRLYALLKKFGKIREPKAENFAKNLPIKLNREIFTSQHLRNPRNLTVL